MSFTEKDRLKQLIEEAKKKTQTTASESTSADVWTWNEEQQKAIQMALEGKSFIINGAAGTGKTTVEKEITRLLIAQNKIPPIDVSTKYLQYGAPGLVITSFTRRAVRNSRKVVSNDIKMHCITLHKLLEFEPVFYEVFDEETQKNRVTMRFEPGRNRHKKLPSTLKTIIIDESSMVGTELYKQLIDALPFPDRVQFIFVGDLYQLPPVYGSAILGFKLLELPIVELKKIYRQAKNSPIISLAHQIKDGEDIPVIEKKMLETSQGKITIHPWKKSLSDFDGVHTASVFLRRLITEGNYDEEEDIILCPQGKTANLAFGTNELNRVIAQELGRKRNALVWEIQSGFLKHYFAEGDRILAGREDAIITKITKNARYFGKRTRPPSVDLDRWGNYIKKPVIANTDADDFDVDKYLDSFTLQDSKETEERKQEASHTIEVELLDSGQKEVFSTAGEINLLEFAYCLTVHKSQGSEWTRVFFITHQSHAVMWSRELLYTAITRARKELYMIVEPDRFKKPGTLMKSAKSPRIKGDTLEEKAEYFKGKKEEFDKQIEELKRAPQGRIVESVYKGRKENERKITVTSSAPPAPLVKLETFISATFKAEALERLRATWLKAQAIWGAEKIGPFPHIRFDLQRSKYVGLAHLKSNTISLNSLWCILSESHPKVREEMLGETLDHEIAHLVAWNYSQDRGHNSGWVMTMKLLGRIPSVYASNDLPTWTDSFKEILRHKELELKLKGADTTEDTTILDPFYEV
jgi:hypothetical protein